MATQTVRYANHRGHRRGYFHMLYLYAFRKMPRPRAGDCAVIALLHDLLVVAGISLFSAGPRCKIDALFIPHVDGCRYSVQIHRGLRPHPGKT